MNSIESVLKKVGFRFDLDYSDIRVMNLEIRLDPEAKETLINMGIEVQDDMLVATSEDSIPLHSLYTTSIIKKYLTNAHVSLYENNIIAFQKWLSDYNDSKPYNIVGMSLSTFSITDFGQSMMADISYLMASVGNSGKNTGYTETDKRFDLVGACDMDNIMCSYSAYGITTVDYVAPDGFTYMNEELFGTSYSRPISTLVACCFSELFKNKYKVFPTPLQLHHIIKRHCIDIDDIGFDVKSGSGLSIVPENDEDIKFFDNIEIESGIISAITPNKDSIDVDFDILNNKDAYFMGEIDYMNDLKYLNSMGKLAYLIRRHLSFNSLDKINYIGDGDSELIDNLVTNGSIFITKMESGKI